MAMQLISQDPYQKQASKASKSSLNNYFLYQPLAEINKPEFLKLPEIRAFCFLSLRKEEDVKNATHFRERCSSFRKISRPQPNNGDCIVHSFFNNEVDGRSFFLNKQEKNYGLRNQLSKEFSAIRLWSKRINPNLW